MCTSTGSFVDFYSAAVVLAGEGLGAHVNLTGPSSALERRIARGHLFGSSKEQLVQLWAVCAQVLLIELWVSCAVGMSGVVAVVAVV